MSGSDKTEKPTPKKLAEARKEGRIARTQDLGAWTGVLGYVLSRYAFSALEAFSRRCQLVVSLNAFAWKTMTTMSRAVPLSVTRIFTSSGGRPAKSESYAVRMSRAISTEATLVL